MLAFWWGIPWHYSISIVYYAIILRSEKNRIATITTFRVAVIEKQSIIHRHETEISNRQKKKQIFFRKITFFFQNSDLSAKLFQTTCPCKSPELGNS